MGNQKQAPLQSSTLLALFILMNICAIRSSPVADPEPKTVKRGDLEMAGMYFQEDHSGAPGSGGGAMGSVYICGYAGSSPKDFEHDAGGVGERGNSLAAAVTPSSDSSSGQGQGKGSASVVAVVAKRIPNRKAAQLKAKAKTVILEAHADASVKSESPYYLRPHILYMPETVDTTTPK